MTCPPCPLRFLPSSLDCPFVVAACGRRVAAVDGLRWREATWILLVGCSLSPRRPPVPIRAEVVGKSQVMLDIKPWSDETDLAAMEKARARALALARFRPVYARSSGDTAMEPGLVEAHVNASTRTHGRPDPRLGRALYTGGARARAGGPGVAGVAEGGDRLRRLQAAHSVHHRAAEPTQPNHTRGFVCVLCWRPTARRGMPVEHARALLPLPQFDDLVTVDEDIIDPLVEKCEEYIQVRAALLAASPRSRRHSMQHAVSGGQFRTVNPTSDEQDPTHSFRSPYRALPCSP